MRKRHKEIWFVSLKNKKLNNRRKLPKRLWKKNSGLIDSEALLLRLSNSKDPFLALKELKLLNLKRVVYNKVFRDKVQSNLLMRLPLRVDLQHQMFWRVKVIKVNFVERILPPKVLPKTVFRKLKVQKASPLKKVYLIRITYQQTILAKIVDAREIIFLVERKAERGLKFRNFLLKFTMNHLKLKLKLAKKINRLRLAN